MESDSREFSTANDSARPQLVLAIEGGVCSGKTTTVRALADQGVDTLPEYVEWLQQTGRALPQGQPLDRLKGYLAVERERALAAETLGPMLVIDRSVLSLAAFEYAMMSLYLPAAWHELKRLLPRAPFIAPNGIIFSDASDGERARLWQQRGLPENSVFISSAFNEGLRNFFLKVQNHIPLKIIRLLERTNETGAAEVKRFASDCSELRPINFPELLDAIPPP